MPSILSRLTSLFPGFRRTYAPNVETPEERAGRILTAVKADIDRSRARPAPAAGERVPTNYNGGAAGKIWFLPFQDSTTQDTPEIRAAMRMMRRDGYVKAAWEPQILAVASEDWQIQPSEAGNPESEEQADALKTAVEDYLAGGIISIVRAICAPLGSDGFSVAEPIWAKATKGRLDRMIVPTALKARDADPTSGDVQLYGDEFGNVTHVKARRKTDQPEWPIEDFVYSRYLTVFDEPLGEAAFRPAYGPYWMRDTVRKLRVIHHEKKMGGMLKGTYQNDDDKGPLEAALARAKAATWISIPEGTQVEAMALSTASEPDYKSFEESLREEIVTSIAFATLQILQGNVPDARGDSKVQKSMADLGPWLLMSLVTDAFNRQLAPRFIDYNYPYPAAGAYPKLTFGAVSNAELLELLQVVRGAQQLGIKPSRKHYAKSLSIQEADPNDPDDDLSAPGAGGFGGGFPPSDPMGGGGFGGPPSDPFGGGGGQMFSERGGAWVFEAFREPVKWSQIQGGRWKSAGGRVLSDAAYQRHVARIKKAGGSVAPAGPTAPPTGLPVPAPVGPPGGPAALPRSGRLKRLAGAAGRGAKAALKAKLAAAKAVGKGAVKAAKVTGSGARKTAGGGIYGAARLSQGLAFAVKKIGTSLKKVKWLENLLGVGSTIERAADIKLQQARTTALLAAGGNTGAAAKRTLTGSLKAAAIQFPQNKRKYGLVPALVMEGAYWGAKYGTGIALGAGVALAGGTLASAGVGAGVAAGGLFVAKNLLGFVISPLIRQAVSYPWRRGKGLRGSRAPHRVLAAQMAAAQKLKAKGKPAFTAAPSAVTADARALAGGPGNLFPLDGSKRSRSRQFAEGGFDVFAEELDPTDFLLAVRSSIDATLAAEGQPPTDVTDEELAELVAALLEHVDTLSDGAVDRMSEKFEAFAWQAGRTRTGSVKAIGTAEDAGKVLYGAKARSALQRGAGAGPRQTALRSVRYTAPDRTGELQKRRAENVSPERARAMAVAAQLAAADGATGAPAGVKVTKQRRPKALADAIKPLEEAAAKAQAGDPAAVQQLADHGQKVAQQAAEAIAAAPPLTPAQRGRIKGAWDKSARGMGKVEKKELDSLLGYIWKSTGKDVDAVGRGVLGLAGWIGRQTAFVARNTVGALARFARASARLAGPTFARVAGLAWGGAKAVARTGKRLGSEAAGDLARAGAQGGDMVPNLLGDAARTAGAVARGLARPIKWAARQAGKVLGPAAWYLGGAAAGAALLAAPVLAVNAGLIPFAAAFAIAPMAAGAAWFAVRGGARRGSRAVGQNFYGYQPERYGMKPTPVLFDGHAEREAWADLFGEGAGGWFEAFAAEWKQIDGGKWKSAGGLVRTNEWYQRMIAGQKGVSAKAPAAPREAPTPTRGGKLAPPAAPQPGRVYQIDPRQIVADPARFQFKLNTDAAGVTKELQSVQRFDPELAGVVAVWRDPADGKTYVVNGHHRLDLAMRTGTRDLAVRYLSAKTAEEARAKGALINIAEGRGTAIDAAKFLRDTGRSADDLAQVGVSLKGQVARDAVELAKLSPVLFRRVTFGAVDPERAVAIARHLPEHGDQERLIAAVEKQDDRSGRPVPPKVVEAMAKEFAAAPTLTRTQETLFGPMEIDDSVYFHRAELKSFVRNELAKEARDFRLGASQRRADALGAVSGNTLATDANKKIADKADVILATFEGQAQLKGALSDALNDYAVEYASANPAARAAIRTAALAAVRKLLSGGEYSGPPRVDRGGPGLFGEGRTE